MTTHSPLTRETGEFERLHQTEREPWEFRDRAAEILRHEWIADTARALRPATTLDLGCTVGQLTSQLASALPAVFALDVSPTAVVTARSRVTRGAATFLSATATALHIAERTFDLVIAADGLYSWNLSQDDRQRALAEVHRVLRPGGSVLFTEHTRPERFVELIREVKQSPLRVLAVTYLYDRPWYRMESWFRAVRRTRLARAIRRNLGIARALQRVGRFFGPSWSRHICILAEREARTVWILESPSKPAYKRNGHTPHAG